MSKNKLSNSLLAVRDQAALAAGGYESLQSFAPMVRRNGSTEVTDIVVIIHCAPDADLSHLAKQGIEVNHQTGSLRTAVLPATKLDLLAAEPAVSWVEASQMARATMDVAAAAVGIPSLHTLAGSAGKGVLIGIVDTGIDPGHPAFQGRILEIWDQTLRGGGGVSTANARFPYGTRLDPTKLAQSFDDEGHGTHVAGIAAGAHAPFKGVAPEAELVIVKTDFAIGHILDALDYLVATAAIRGLPGAPLPIVINLSLGVHSECAHDGTDQLSMKIDQLSGPGIVFCCAAGNEGDEGIHAHREPSATSPATLQVLAPGGFSGGFTLWGWHAPQPLALSVITPSGFPTPSFVSEPGLRTSLSTPDGDIELSSQLHVPSGDIQLQLNVSRRSARKGIWTVSLSSTAAAPVRVDFWVTNGAGPPAVSFIGSDGEMTIGAPGCAEQAITVGAVVARSNWAEPKEGPKWSVQATPSSVWPASGRGPLRPCTARGGVTCPKPDFVAPGGFIASAWPGGLIPPNGYLVSGEPKYVIQSGTSMATAFMSGIIATLLSTPATFGLPARPTAADIRKHLQGRTQPAAAAHSPVLGFGPLRF